MFTLEGFLCRAAQFLVDRATLHLHNGNGEDGQQRDVLTDGTSDAAYRHRNRNICAYRVTHDV